MLECRLTKTANRSTVGIMSEFGFLADATREPGQAPDLHHLSLQLARTLCSPLYTTHVSPDRALAAVVRQHDLRHRPIL